MAGTPKSTAPANFWTDWMGYMKDAVGEDDARYKYWQNLVRRSYNTYPLDMVSFCTAGPYTPIEMTAANFEQYGATQIFLTWMMDYMYQQWCDDDNSTGGGGGTSPGS